MTIDFARFWPAVIKAMQGDSVFEKEVEESVTLPASGQQLSRLLNGFLRESRKEKSCLKKKKYAISGN